MIPYVKIRDNPHVTRQEWAALKLCSSSIEKSNKKELIKKESGHKSDNTRGIKTFERNNLDRKNCDEKEEIVGNDHSGCESKHRRDFKDGSAMFDVIVLNDFLEIIQQNPDHERCQIESHTKAMQSDFCNEISAPKESNEDEAFQPSKRLCFSEKLLSHQLIEFLQSLIRSSEKFSDLFGKPIDETIENTGLDGQPDRIYTIEIIELSARISLILLLPNSDEVCSVVQNQDVNSLLNPHSDLIYTPLKVFELIHMNTYRPDFASQYWRVSALLEFDIMAVQQAQREAFSKSEAAIAKALLCQLLDFQSQLDEHCRSMRWIIDVVTNARDKQANVGVDLHRLRNFVAWIEKQMLKETNDNSLMSIPKILLPNESISKIDLKNECRSTPPSPYRATANIDRRKSRDDSFLEHYPCDQSQHSSNYIEYLTFDQNVDHQKLVRVNDQESFTKNATIMMHLQPDFFMTVRDQKNTEAEDCSHQSIEKSSYSLCDKCHSASECEISNDTDNDIRRCLSASKLIDDQTNRDQTYSFEENKNRGNDVKEANKIK
ncbi:hypothetical protein QR98_0046230 [Sarcoptes scabiei]|uniref:Uncharacterized protein n=1 Tax=Sarcoptes scabiei TaxID=52283 RepID=A0A132A6W4_SARSC|nr:hypothetical protein QR98_0046230 [Sarcoptes scabiei]